MMILRSGGLHDLDMDLATEKVLKNNELYLKEKNNPTNNTMHGIWN
jgi:hypothetical protein